MSAVESILSSRGSKGKRETLNYSYYDNVSLVPSKAGAVNVQENVNKMLLFIDF